jgi:hypothetical protein
MVMNWKRGAVVLGLVAAAFALSACGQMSDDSYGVYADGDFFIVANYAKHKINFTSDTQPGADVLLQQIENGQGIGYTTWRNATSCGLRDAKGNNFVVPRSDSLDYDGETFKVTHPKGIFATANGDRPDHEETITASRDGATILAYVYDDTLGIRSIDRYSNGVFDRKIVLMQGVGLLEHCRGASLDDQAWYNKLNRDSKAS